MLEVKESLGVVRDRQQSSEGEGESRNRNED
jgi:hypothetical protein